MLFSTLYWGETKMKKALRKNKIVVTLWTVLFLSVFFSMQGNALTVISDFFWDTQEYQEIGDPLTRKQVRVKHVSGTKEISTSEVMDLRVYDDDGNPLLYQLNVDFKKDKGLTTFYIDGVSKVILGAKSELQYLKPDMSSEQKKMNTIYDSDEFYYTFNLVKAFKDGVNDVIINWNDHNIFGHFTSKLSKENIAVPTTHNFMSTYHVPEKIKLDLAASIYDENGAVAADKYEWYLTGKFIDIETEERQLVLVGTMGPSITKEMEIAINRAATGQYTANISVYAGTSAYILGNVPIVNNKLILYSGVRATKGMMTDVNMKMIEIEITGLPKEVTGMTAELVVTPNVSSIDRANLVDGKAVIKLDMRSWIQISPKEEPNSYKWYIGTEDFTTIPDNKGTNKTSKITEEGIKFKASLEDEAYATIRVPVLKNMNVITLYTGVRIWSDTLKKSVEVKKAITIPLTGEAKTELPVVAPGSENLDADEPPTIEYFMNGEGGKYTFNTGRNRWEIIGESCNYIYVRVASVVGMKDAFYSFHDGSKFVEVNKSLLDISPNAEGFRPVPIPSSMKEGNVNLHIVATDLEGKKATTSTALQLRNDYNGDYIVPDDKGSIRNGVREVPVASLFANSSNTVDALKITSVYDIKWKMDAISTAKPVKIPSMPVYQNAINDTIGLGYMVDFRLDMLGYGLDTNDKVTVNTAFYGILGNELVKLKLFMPDGNREVEVNASHSFYGQAVSQVFLKNGESSKNLKSWKADGEKTALEFGYYLPANAIFKYTKDNKEIKYVGNEVLVTFKIYMKKWYDGTKGSNTLHEYTKRTLQSMGTVVNTTYGKSRLDSRIQNELQVFWYDLKNTALTDVSGGATQR